MKLVISFAVATILSTATSTFAGGSNTHYRSDSGGPVVVVSCFRGPWQQIIWDHPQAPFVDSLVNIGYSFAQATAIAERVCRDRALVGNTEGLRETTRSIIASAPRS